MANVQVFIVSMMLLMADYTQSAAVSQVDEDRAINATRQMIQRLEQEMAPGIRNVYISNPSGEQLWTS